MLENPPPTTYSTYESQLPGLNGLNVLLGIGGGALLGLIVGAVIRTEKWERLDIPNQGAASITPVIGVHPAGRLALGARISF